MTNDPYRSPNDHRYSNDYYISVAKGDTPGTMLMAQETWEAAMMICPGTTATITGEEEQDKMRSALYGRSYFIL